ncbi:MAG: DNA-binding response regulator [Acidobacteria bacterium]|nr:DNA-binding response regulator [Acidobacteriota bacterium]
MSNGRPLLSRDHNIKNQIADISPRTVQFHKYTMMQALEVSSTAELIRYGIQNRLI